ncbi:MAG: hypothetical protein AAF543_07040 [Pseudomonadota bacterium]
MRTITGCISLIGVLTIVGCASVEGPAQTRPAASDTGVPGETLGNAILQHDTKMPVIMAAVTKMSDKECPARAFELTDTKVLSQPVKLAVTPDYTSWRELWTVKGCDETVDVEVTYMNHVSRGTTIAAK